MEKRRKENLCWGRCKFKPGSEALQKRIKMMQGLILFVAAQDGCLLFLHINQHQCLSQLRKRDQPPVVYPEGSAAVVRWWLLPIHRFSDHTALQQGCGMDHLLQARVSVPHTGVLSLNTHTHSQTAIFSMHSQIPFARSQWITCCPMVPAHKSFFPSFTSPLLFFLLSSPAPLLIKPKVPTYSTLLGRKRKPIACTKMTLWDDSCTYVMMFVSNGSWRVFNKIRLRIESHYHAAQPSLTVVNINYY